MSKLQSALQSYPQGSVVSQAMMRDHKTMARIHDENRAMEIIEVKRHQILHECSWNEAVKAIAQKKSPSSNIGA